MHILLSFQMKGAILCLKLSCNNYTLLTYINLNFENVVLIMQMWQNCYYYSRIFLMVFSCLNCMQFCIYRKQHMNINMFLKMNKDIQENLWYLWSFTHLNVAKVCICNSFYTFIIVLKLYLKIHLTYENITKLFYF